MPKSMVPAILGSAAVSGFVFHQVLFKRVEVDRQPVLLAVIVLFSPLVMATALYQASEEFASFWHAWLVGTATVLTSLFSLFVNILVYRAFFHSLNDFPGPFVARLSKFWTLARVIKSRTRWYLEAGKLREIYGDYVRTGPRELLIFDPAAISPVLGYASKTGKGPFYDSMELSVSTNRDKEFHRMRRKVWDNALKNALADYGPRIEEFTGNFMIRIGKSLGKPVIINELCIHYSYDVMSALAYGEAMGFIEGKSTEIADTILRNIQDGVDAIGLLLHVPWLMATLTSFSFCIGPMKRWNQWSEEQVVTRRSFKNPKPDIMGHLLANTEDTRRGRALLNADSRIIVSAGSDTTATALTAIFIELACNPQYCEKIQEEVASLHTSNSFNSSQSRPFLDGVINEGLRLHPSVTFGPQRVTPPEGIHIASKFIPGNTVISIAPYQLLHDPRNFVRPNEFIPERWSSQPELILNKNAFIPFSTGPNNCPGQTLARMELRSVISRVVTEYEFGFPPNSNFDHKAFFANVKDHFVAGIPKQALVFKKRI